MGVACNHMNQPVFEKLLSAALHLFPEFAGKTHGRDLAQGSHGNEIIEKVHILQGRRVPFRVSDDGRDALNFEAEDLFFNAGRNGLGREFQQEILPGVVDGSHSACPDFVRDSRGQVNVGSFANPQIKTSCSQEFPKRSNASGDFRRGDVVDAVQGVRGGDDGVNAVLSQNHPVLMPQGVVETAGFL